MISENQLSYYFNKGELNLPKFLKKIEVNKVKKEFDKFIKYKIDKMTLGKDYSLSKSKKIPSSLHRLEKFKDSYFYKLAKKKEVISFASKLIGDKVKLHSIQFFMKYAKDNHATPLHQDNAYWCFKKGKGASFWIAINKVSKKNGGMYYLQGSHKKNHLHSSSAIPGSSLVVKKTKKNFKKKYYSLNPGDAVVHDSKTIHGSFGNKVKDNRIGFILCYVSKNAIQDGILKKNYEKKLKKINSKKLN